VHKWAWVGGACFACTHSRARTHARGGHTMCPLCCLMPRQCGRCARCQRHVLMFPAQHLASARSCAAAAFVCSSSTHMQPPNRTGRQPLRRCGADTSVSSGGGVTAVCTHGAWLALKRMELAYELCVVRSTCIIASSCMHARTHTRTYTHARAYTCRRTRTTMPVAAPLARTFWRSPLGPILLYSSTASSQPVQ